MRESQDDRERLRGRVLRALQRYFANQRWPRLMMSGILIITGGAGFLASFGMLQAGMTTMWIRYPLAVLFAWSVLLALLRLWAAVERRCFEVHEELTAVLEQEESGESRRVSPDSQRSTRRWWEACEVDFPSIEFGDEGCLPVFFLALVIAIFSALLALAAGVVFGAPLLIAEVFLDAVLVAALYKKVRGLTPRWWLSSAARKTAAPVLLTALLLMIGGAVFELIDPRARSIGDVWQTVRAPLKSPTEFDKLEK